MAAVVLGGCTEGTSGGAEVPLIRSSVDYAEILADAEKVASPPLSKVASGQPLTEADKKELRRAAGMFQGLVAYQPAKQDSHIALARIYEALGESDKAMQQYREASELTPAGDIPAGDPEIAMADSKPSGEEKTKLQAAAQAAEAKAEKNPKDSASRYKAGRLYEAVGQKEKAVENYRKLIVQAGSPEDQVLKEAPIIAERLLLKYGKDKKLSTVEMSEMKLLVTVYDRLVGYEPQNADLWYTAGNLNMVTGNPTRAIEKFREYTKLKKDPKTEVDYFKVSAAHYWSAVLGTKLGRFKEAVADAEVAASMYPNSLKILVAAAEAHLGAKQYDRASEFLQAALALDPKDPEALALKAKLASAYQ